MVQPNVSSEVMVSMFGWGISRSFRSQIKRIMHGLMKEKAGTEDDGGKEINALVKLLKKFPFDQAKV